MEMLLKYLKSNDFELYANSVFSEYSDKLNKEIKKKDFATILKAYILDMYNIVDDENKDKFVKKIKYSSLTKDEIDYFILRLNACFAEPNAHVNKESEEFFEELESYKDNRLCNELSKYGNEVFEMVAEDLGGLFTIKQIKDGEYYIPHKGENGRPDKYGYLLEDDEIEAIEKAHKAGTLVDVGHSLYDDVNYIPHVFLGKVSFERQFNCDYEKADEDGLGCFVFHTGKDTPQYKVDIVFEDGVIMSYHKGDIRKNPYNMKDILSYIYADAARELNDMGINESNISSLDPEELRDILLYSGLEIFSQSEFFSEIYSKKMINNSKAYVKKLVKIVNDENL